MDQLVSAVRCDAMRARTFESDHPLILRTHNSSSSSFLCPSLVSSLLKSFFSAVQSVFYLCLGTALFLSLSLFLFLKHSIFTAAATATYAYRRFHPLALLFSA